MNRWLLGKSAEDMHLSGTLPNGHANIVNKACAKEKTEGAQLTKEREMSEKSIKEMTRWQISYAISAFFQIITWHYQGLSVILQRIIHKIIITSVF